MTHEQLLDLVATLKRLGFTHAYWEKTSQGLRAEGPGKFQVPSHSTARNVCLVHGNPVRVLRETCPARNKGVRILSVHPCPLCTPEEALMQVSHYSGAALTSAAS